MSKIKWTNQLLIPIANIFFRIHDTNRSKSLNATNVSVIIFKEIANSMQAATKKTFVNKVWNVILKMVMLTN